MYKLHDFNQHLQQKNYFVGAFQAFCKKQKAAVFVHVEGVHLIKIPENYL